MTNLALMVVSQTTSTITLGWTPPTGAQWYTFYTDGVRVSNAPPVSKTGVVKKTIKFAVGASQHQVVAICLNAGVFSLAVGTWDKTSSPAQPVFSGDQSFAAHSPPSGSPPLFNGDFETASPPYAPFQTPQAHNYGNPVDTPHASFGSWFRDTTDANTGKACARVDLPGTGTAPYERAQTITTSPQAEGQTVVWTAAFKFPANMAGGQCLISEPWYQALPAPASSPGLALFWRKGQGVELVVSTGACQSTPPVFQYNSLTGAGGIPHLWALGGGTKQPAADVWHQFIMAFYLARDKSGTIQVEYRQKGASAWAKNIDVKNLATLQYRASDGFIGSSVTNMIGCYRQKTPGAISLKYDSFFRFKTVADAKAWLG